MTNYEKSLETIRKKTNAAMKSSGSRREISESLLGIFEDSDPRSLKDILFNSSIDDADETVRKASLLLWSSAAAGETNPGKCANLFHRLFSKPGDEFDVLELWDDDGDSASASPFKPPFEYNDELFAYLRVCSETALGFEHTTEKGAVFSKEAMLCFFRVSDVVGREYDVFYDWCDRFLRAMRSESLDAEKKRSIRNVATEIFNHVFRKRFLEELVDDYPTTSFEASMAVLFFLEDKSIEKEFFMDKISTNADKNGDMSVLPILVDTDATSGNLMFDETSKEFFADRCRRDGFFGVLLKHGMTTVDELLESVADEGADCLFNVFWYLEDSKPDEQIIGDVETCFSFVCAHMEQAVASGNVEKIASHGVLWEDLNKMLGEGARQVVPSLGRYMESFPALAAVSPSCCGEREEEPVL